MSTKAQSPNDARTMGRREFLALVGAAGVAAAAPGAAHAAAAAADSARAAAPAPAGADAEAPPSADALALVSVLRRRFPDRLDAAQWGEVARQVDQRLATGKRLAERVLANGVEPDTVFRP